MRKELTLQAAVENIPQFTDFLEQVLEPLDCPPKVQIQLEIAIDELVSNVAYYAYPQGSGIVTMVLETIEEPRGICLTFMDNGTPYDPLKKADPDVTASLEDRQAGGLGIFMVKKSMDRMEYAYQDGKNCLTITKYL